MDSIGLTELVLNLGEFYSLGLTPAIAFEHQTLHSFVNYLITEHADVLAPKYPTVANVEEKLTTENTTIKQIKETKAVNKIGRAASRERLYISVLDKVMD